MSRSYLVLIACAGIVLAASAVNPSLSVTVALVLAGLVVVVGFALLWYDLPHAVVLALVLSVVVAASPYVLAAVTPVLLIAGLVRAQRSWSTAR